MKLLVTGGAGYVGSVVTRLLLDDGHEVVVLDDLRTGHAAALAPDATVVRASISDAAARVLTPDSGFEGILHLAGLIAAGESMLRPERYWAANTIGSLALLDAARAAGVPRFVFSSTAAVYGDPAELPIPETAATGPANTYGATKLAVDLALASEAYAYGLAAVSLRYFNVAGAYLRPAVALGERHDPETHLIPLALQVAAGRRNRLLVYGDDYPTVDGTCVRDYIHVEDLARAHLLALGQAVAGTHRIYNLGNGSGFSIRQVVDVVRQVTGRPVPVEIAARRDGDPAALVASARRARDELGWQPAKASLVDIVTDAWAFHRQQLG